MILKGLHQASGILKVVHYLVLDFFRMSLLTELLLRDSHAEFLVVDWEMFIHQHKIVDILLRDHTRILYEKLRRL